MDGGSRIHRGLTGGRALVGTPYLADPELRAEYEREIAPRTGAALGRVLGSLYGGGSRALPRRMLDLGAGTGAAAGAVRELCAGAVEITSVDRVAAPGVVVADLESGPLPGAVRGPFDLIVAAHVLNELHAAEEGMSERAGLRARLVLAWGEQLLQAEGGLLVLLEPALRETSRELLAVRDAVLATGRLHVVAPCFMAGPCPALARERDWCHDAAPWPGPPDGRRAARVDFSYLVLARRAPSPPPPGVVRVVSDPMPEKGKLRLFVCGGAGRQALVRLDRHRSPANAALDEARRGDVLQIENTQPSGDGQRLGPDSTVRRQVERSASVM